MEWSEGQATPLPPGGRDTLGYPAGETPLNAALSAIPVVNFWNVGYLALESGFEAVFRKASVLLYRSL